jgi:hypothetical protein
MHTIPVKTLVSELEKGWQPDCVFLDGLDIMQHVLKGDIQQSAYKNNDPWWYALDHLKAELAKGQETDHEFNEQIRYISEDRRGRRSITSDCGEFDLDLYLNANGNRPEVFIDEVMDITEKDAVSVVFDLFVPAGKRDGTDVIERHKAIYKIVLEMEERNIPCRVVAAMPCYYSEFGDKYRSWNSKGRWYFVVKHYESPMIPALWGAIKNNQCANSLINAFCDFIIGTHDFGNGHMFSVNVSQDITQDKIILVDTGPSVQL